MKTPTPALNYRTFGIAYPTHPLTWDVIHASKVESNKDTVVFDTPTGPRSFEWDKIFAFIEDDPKVNESSQERDIVSEIFRGDGLYRQTRRHGRIRCWSKTKPRCLCGEINRALLSKVIAASLKVR